MFTESSYLSVDASGGEVEEGVLVEVADGGSVRAADAVCLDLQRGHHVQLQLAAQQQGATELVRAGLLRSLGDADAPLEGRLSPGS
jgi:hypothetical protein